METVLNSDVVVREINCLQTDKELIIYLDGEINKTLIDGMCYLINKANIESNIDNIIMYIDSHGGDLTSAFKLVDLMELSKVHITTICMGSADSSALIILMSGHTRLISKRSSCVSHKPSLTLAPDVELSALDLKRINKDHQKTEADLVILYMEKTKLSEKEIRSKLLKDEDVMLYAQDALHYGIVDAILAKGVVDMYGYIDDNNQDAK